MGRQRNGTESPNKSTLEKAKRAAVKACQDLAGAFTTESEKDVTGPDLDAVDASPVQIPKKSVMIPASSPDPHSSSSKVTHASLQKPPETVTIPI